MINWGGRHQEVESVVSYIGGISTISTSSAIFLTNVCKQIWALISDPLL